MSYFWHRLGVSSLRRSLKITNSASSHSFGRGIPWAFKSESALQHLSRRRVLGLYTENLGIAKSLYKTTRFLRTLFTASSPQLEFKLWRWSGIRDWERVWLHSVSRPFSCAGKRDAFCDKDEDFTVCESGDASGLAKTNQDGGRPFSRIYSSIYFFTLRSVMSANHNWHRCE